MKSESTTVNRKARFDYSVLKEYVAGLVLKGRSVKDVRSGRISLVDTFAHFRLDGQLVANVSAGGHGEIVLLLNKRELREIREEIKKPGLTLVPLKVFFAHGLAKMSLGLCKGKKEYDKRASIKARDLDKEIRSCL